MKASFVWLFAVCALALSSSSASAEQRVFTLEYAAPAGCLTEEEFRDEVAARLGRIPFSDSGARLVVTIVAQRSGFLGTLEVAGGERILRNADCATLARDLGAALAVQLDAPAEHAPPPQPGVVGMRVPDDVTKVRVDVQTADPDLSLHVVNAQSFGYGSVNGQAAVMVGYQFASLCSVPCTLELEAKDYHFAVARGVNPPIPLPNRIRLEGPSRLDVDYRSRRVVRIVGYVTGLATTVAGGVVFWRGLTNDTTSLAIAGSSMMGGGLLVGLAFGMVRDKVRVELTPAP